MGAKDHDENPIKEKHKLRDTRLEGKTRSEIPTTILKYHHNHVVHCT